jgi:hypothetical protein
MSLFHYAVRLSLPALLSIVACACSSASAPSSQPVIDSITLPPSFTVSNGTQYSATGTITFHDTSVAITAMREKIPSYNLDADVALSGAGEQGTATILVGFQAPSAIASGTTIEIDISLVDANGVESNVEVEQISVP